MPICPRCGNRVPHGYVVGTWLPCSCKSVSEDDYRERIIKNAELEHQQRKEVK